MLATTARMIFIWLWAIYLYFQVQIRRKLYAIGVVDSSLNGYVLCTLYSVYANCEICSSINIHNTHARCTYRLWTTKTGITIFHFRHMGVLSQKVPQLNSLPHIFLSSNVWCSCAFCLSKYKAYSMAPWEIRVYMAHFIGPYSMIYEHTL